MGSTFNPQILGDKLARLNHSQQSIETLSHWCIFHMNKAKQVVETWDRQFHCSPREQRLAFLYLANDILQNSRRKGSEFVGEFRKVLPDALCDVMKNGDEFGRNAVLRLVSIWEDRKVFVSRGQSLKEELLGRQPDNSNRNTKHSGSKLRPSAGNALDKIVSGYQVVYGGPLDEDVLLSKCSNAISCIEKVNKEIQGEIDSAKLTGSCFIEEIQGQHAVLRDCIEQLMAVESSRANLVSQLREALQEQEFKLDQVRHQIRLARSQSEQANTISRQLLKDEHIQLLAEQNVTKPRTSESPHGHGQSPFVEKPGEDTKSTAAAVAAKLSASTSSAQMLTYALSFLASEGVIGNAKQEPSGDYPLEKKPKLDNDHSSYVPPHNAQAPLLHDHQPLLQPFPHLGSLHDSLQHTAPIVAQGVAPNEQPPPPSSPPPVPPLPPMQPYPVPEFMQTAGPINFPYGYGPIQPLQPPGYPTLGAQVNGASSFAAPLSNPYQNYQNLQESEGSFYGQASSLPMAPISRQ